MGWTTKLLGAVGLGTAIPSHGMMFRNPISSVSVYQVLPVVTHLGVLSNYVTFSRVIFVTSIWGIKLGHDWKKLVLLYYSYHMYTSRILGLLACFHESYL